MSSVESMYAAGAPPKPTVFQRLLQCLPGIRLTPSIHPSSVDDERYNDSSVAAAPASVSDSHNTAPTKEVLMICSLCIEPGALKRKCCNGLYCDHCWTKNGKCPYCGLQTKQEAQTGATFQVKVFSEHEECRICLDPGTLRRCCNNYYCDTCYYKVPNCRSCGTDVGKLSQAKWSISFNSATCLNSLLGWLITIFIVCVAIVFSAIIITVEIEKPIGIFNYKCYGFFRTCDRTLCWDMDYSVATGDSPVPAQSDWQFCDLDSIAKLQSKACIFDDQLYDLSKRQLGFDVCADDFSEGLYIFDDGFEYWETNEPESSLMKSAKWDSVVNGKTTQYCGAAPSPDRGSPGGPNYKSLSFAGELARRADTQDLDVSSGGRLEFELFFPPIGSEIDTPLCKTGYQGMLEVLYSIDGGSNWVLMNEYDPQLLRRTIFFHVEIELPVEAWTNSTRIRFNQPFFEAQRDHFALDNVKVLRYLPKDWNSSGKWKKSLERTWRVIQKAQCCVDSDWCKHRLRDDESYADSCDVFDWYTGKTRHTIRMVELFVLCAACINILKFIYVSLQDYFMRERYPFQDEINELLLLDSVKQRLPVKFRSTSINADDEAHRVHTSARMEQNVRDQLDEGMGQGNLKKREDEIEKEQKAIAKALKKKQKRLKERMNKKNFKGIPGQDGISMDGKVLAFGGQDKPKGGEGEDDVLELEASVSDVSAVEFKAGIKSVGMGQNGDATGAWSGLAGGQASTSTYKPASAAVALSPLPSNMEEGKAQFAEEEATATDLDRVRRQNMAMLRIPFDIDWDPTMCRTFAAAALLVFIVMFLLEMSVVSPADIHQSVNVYGSYNGDFVCSSYVIVFLAAYCDVKEIWYTIKFVIPCREKWVPLVTVDLGEDSKSLYIGKNIVPLSQIYEFQAFTIEWMYAIFSAYSLAVFPFTLFALVLRDMNLNFGENRVVVPTLGSVFLLRALLGPGVFIKMSYSIKFLFDLTHSTREKIGKAFGTEQTRNAALTAIAIFLFLSILICTIIAIKWVGVIIAAAIFSGAIYGSFSACVHQLPIRPWMIITTLKRGVWMHLKRKQRCPCYYWGAYLTELHNFDELSFIHTTDEVKFMTVVKGGVGHGNF